MIPVHCRVKDDPEKGIIGDCMRACVASILELEPEDVPHFVQLASANADEAFRLQNEWLAARKLSTFVVCYPGEISLDDLLAIQGGNGSAYYILNGSTGEGDHAVVCRGGAIVHDPAWYRVPFVGPSVDSGMWIIYVLAVA